MDLKTLLKDEIEREYAYLCEQEVGSEDYVHSLQRLGGLEDKFVNLTQFETEDANKKAQLEDEKRDRRNKNII
jgi:hypothetical protein